MKFFTSITRKVAAIILTSLILGIGFVAFYFAYGQNSSTNPMTATSTK